MWEFPYGSQRMPVFAQNVVATSQPLAAQAGLQMLAAGGNAVDAALASAIALTVLEPTSNGIGSDAFAMVWDGEALHGLNGSGRSPRGWRIERFAGRDEMPMLGWDAVTVPGAVDLWVTLSQRFGRLPFAQLFAPAIRYAREGFLVSPKTASHWSLAAQRFASFASFVEGFLPGGQAPAVGERFRFPAQADTLEEIASSRGESFYRGRLAACMVEDSRRHGGVLSEDDLGQHHAQWVTPLSQPYRDVTLHELPPNGQGLAALIAVGLLEHHDLARFPVDSVDSIHLQIEAMKAAFGLAYRTIADPAWMQVAPSALLEPERLADWADRLDLSQAAPVSQMLPFDHGTVYLATGDAQGQMVSLIQSNYWGFGSGVVVPETGISLQNRGFGFNLTPGHPNCVAGGKRPFHTIIPGFVTQQGAPLLSFGVMGGPMQPQGHVQMMTRLFAYQQNPQAASDAPRWFVHRDGSVELETGFSDALVDGLKARGHEVSRDATPWRFGGAQLVWRLANGGYCAASDHRKDGQAVGF